MNIEPTDRATTTDPPITHQQFQALLTATETTREELIVRLPGQAGLQTSDLPQLRPEVIRQVTATPPQGIATLDSRSVFLLPPVMETVAARREQTSLAPSAPLFSISPRRIQMLFSDLTTRAATATDTPELAAVTIQDLRQYFAHTALVDWQIPLRVVGAVGDWTVGGGLRTQLPPVSDEEIIKAFTQTEKTLDEELPLVSIREAMLGADTPTAVATAVCQTAAETAHYDGAWVIEHEYADMSRIWAAAGIEDDQILQWHEQTDKRISEQSVTITTIGPAAHRALLVPVATPATNLGILGLLPARQRHIGTQERARLAGLGKELAQLIIATRWRQLLTSEAATELEIHSESDQAPLIRIAQSLDASVSVEGLVTDDRAGIVCYASIDQLAPTVVAELSDHVETARLVERQDHRTRVELHINKPNLASLLTDMGAVIETFVIDDGVGELTAVVPRGTDIRGIIVQLREQFPGTELASKHTRNELPQTDIRQSTQPIDELTDRQQTAIQTALLSGYFEWPRGSTAEELADAMDISSPTFHRHLRRGLQTVLETVFEKQDSPR